MNFPHIQRATLLIARDLGTINRTCSERDVVDRLAAFLSEFDPAPLTKIDAWLGDLALTELQTVCYGDHVEMLRLTGRAPPGTDAVLDLIAEQVV